MLIMKDTKFIQVSFRNEEEIEQVVLENAEEIFGASAIYLPKALFRTNEGSGTVPDGIVLDISARRWFIVEVELASHGVWRHIAPQIAKQLIAMTQPASRQRLTVMALGTVMQDEAAKQKFTELGIEDSNIPTVVAEAFAQDPVVAVPIDRVGTDLKEWAATLRNDVRLWEIKKYIDESQPERVAYEVPDEQPVSLAEQQGAGPRNTYDVTVQDLVNSKARLLPAGSKLRWEQRVRGAAPVTHEATVTEEGSIAIGGEEFSNPGGAASYAAKIAGTPGPKASAWLIWKDEKGSSLHDLREKYLQNPEEEA